MLLSWKFYIAIEEKILKNIPFGSRIIAVADSIDAMISDRPYRKGMCENVCREQIEKNIGIMYDPQIASCVIEHWNEVLKSREDESNNCMEKFWKNLQYKKERCYDENVHARWQSRLICWIV